MKTTLVLLIFFSFIPMSVQSQGIIIEEESQPADGEVDRASSPDVLKMYRYFTDKRSMEPWDVQKELEAQGVTVLFSQKGYDGLRYQINKLVEDSPAINIVLVPMRFYDTLKRLGFFLCRELEDEGGDCHPVSYSGVMESEKKSFVTHIYKSAEKKSCDPDSGIEISVMEKEFAKSKIVVYQRYQAVDGRAYSLHCGSNTADINVFVIERSKLSESILIGYRECAWLEQQGGACYPFKN